MLSVQYIQQFYLLFVQVFARLLRSPPHSAGQCHAKAQIIRLQYTIESSRELELRPGQGKVGSVHKMQFVIV